MRSGLQALGDLADREARGVGGQRHVGPRELLHLGEQLAFQRQVFRRPSRPTISIDAQGPRARWAARPEVSLGLPIGGARAEAAGRLSRVDAERDTTSTFQPPPKNMAMIPPPWCRPDDQGVAFALRHSCPPNSTRAPTAGQYHRSLIARERTNERHLQGYRHQHRGPCRVVEIQRPPHNFFDNSLINQIADAFEAFDRDDQHPVLRSVRRRASRSALAPISQNRPHTGVRPKRQAPLQGSDPPVPLWAAHAARAGPGDRRWPRPSR